jgi:hypothetical protein
MMVVPDVHGMFVPVSEDIILVRYSDPRNKAVIDALLDKLPSIFQNTKVQEAALGPAIQAAALTLVSSSS